MRKRVEQLTEELDATRASVNQLQRVFDEAPIGVVVWDANGQMQYVNQPVLHTTGAPGPAGFADLADVTAVHPDDREHVLAATVVARSGRYAPFRARLRNALGEWKNLEGSLVPMLENGRTNGVVALFRDVTMERLQDQTVIRFKAIADSTSDIVGITATDGSIVYLNPAGVRFFGDDHAAPDELKQLFEFIPREYHRVLLGDAYQAIMRGEVWQGEVELVRRSDLARCPMSAVALGVYDERGDLSGIAITYRDMSERKRMEAELAHAATHDALTGLANRQELFLALDTSINSGASTAVLFFDLDDFKVVNDSLGHVVGDEVLRTLAVRIRDAARGTDVVGRLGGDEFLVICRGVWMVHDAKTIADKILARVSEPMQIGGRLHAVTGSIGVAMSGGRECTAVSLIQEADIAMYRAKAAGRRQAVVFDDSMRVEAVDRLEFDLELRVALENDEFELYFQPLFYFGLGSTSNFEAFIRWNHPRHGLLGPNDFMPMVEQLGMMSAVGQWVFRAAARAVAAMRLIQANVAVGVNVHPDQLREAGFVDSVTRAIASARISGEALAIEITEHAVMDDVGLIRHVLEDLQSIGVSIAIDDFGTGYSNLGLLRKLPVDYLKIDKSFVAGLGIEPGDTQVVRMILGLSEELGIHVIAEGVETQLQATELERLGCEVGQGYFYARPMPFDDAIELLRAQQANPPSMDMIVPVMKRAASEAM